VIKFKPAKPSVFAALLFGWCLVMSALAQPAAADPERYNNWQDMCQEHACADLPMDHLTASFGGQYYYFPMRRLTYPDWQTIDPKEEPLEILRGNLTETPDMPRRTFSNLGLSLLRCCDEMFRWFGLPEISGERSMGNSIAVRPYKAEQLHSGWAGSSSLRSQVYGEKTIARPEIDPPQIPLALRTDYSSSFWRLADSHLDVMLVSKKPILADSYVVMRCRNDILCMVTTLRPADTAKRPPLYVEMRLWSPNLENDGAEKIAAFVTAVDKMLRLARIHPKER